VFDICWIHNEKVRKIFFSEEKKQKTFISGAVAGSRPWPRSWVAENTRTALNCEPLQFPFSSEKEGLPGYFRWPDPGA
jgi:hypothetical protein